MPRRSEQYFAPMRFLHGYQLYQHLPMKRGHLPDDGFDPQPMTLAYDGDRPLSFMVRCLPKAPTNGMKSSKHRVYVQCNCGRQIPFGRMVQHFRGPKCRKDA